MSKNPKSIFIEQNPVISHSHKNPTHEDNSLSVPKTFKKTPQISINEISTKEPEKILLNYPDKKSDQLKTSQPLTITDNNRDNSAKKEAILVAKIKQLESQLIQTTTERDNLKIEKEKAEVLAQKEKQRADQLETKLKTVAQILYR